MRGQFSIEFLIDVSLVIILVGFLSVFLGTFTHTDTIVQTMSNLCSLTAQGINFVSNSAGFSAVRHVFLLNQTLTQNYNFSVSRGVIIVFLVPSSGIPSVLVSGTNAVSCGADTRLTANESFGLGNMAVYKNGTTINLAYLYANKSQNGEPTELFGGGFSGNVTVYLTYTNGTTAPLVQQNRTFSYNVSTFVPLLPAGIYSFTAQQISEPQIYVSFPFTVG